MSWLRASLALVAAIAGLAMLRTLPTSAHAAVQPRAAQILVMIRMPPAHHRPRAGYGGSYGDTASRAARRRIAEKIAERHGFRLVEGWPMPLLGVDCFVMELPSGMTEADAIARAQRDPNVAWSQPMQQFRTMSATAQNDNDPLFRAQPSALSWRLMDLHRIATGKGIAVAVIDSKVQIDHPDLAGQFVANMDFVGTRGAPPELHGTGIAGVIGAKSNNGLGIAGVAPGARLMALRACWQEGAEKTLCDSLSLARALEFSIQRRAQVINLSLSGPDDLLLGRLIEVATSRGTVVVAAFDPKLPRGGFPASQPGVVAVSDQALPSSSPLVYVAPGRDVPTTRPGGTWYLADGSSYAAAHVSGLFALMREHGKTTRLITTAGRKIDACASLLQAPPNCDCDCALAALAGHHPKR